MLRLTQAILALPPPHLQTESEETSLFMQVGGSTSKFLIGRLDPQQGLLDMDIYLNPRKTVILEVSGGLGLQVLGY